MLQCHWEYIDRCKILREGEFADVLYAPLRRCYKTFAYHKRKYRDTALPEVYRCWYGKTFIGATTGF